MPMRAPHLPPNAIARRASVGACNRHPNWITSMTSPILRASTDFKTPLACYFDDNHSNVTNVLQATVPDATVDKNLKPVLPCKSPRGATEAGNLKSPMTKFFDGGDETMEVYHDSSMPWKSPMSAFFDGDGFPVYDSPKSECTNSSSLAESASIPSPTNLQIMPPGIAAIHSPLAVATPLSFHVLQAGQTSPALCLPGTAVNTSSPYPMDCPSAVKLVDTTIQSNSKCVTWADRITDTAQIPLAEVAHAPVQHASLLAQRVWKLSQDPQGTFEVQNALEKCGNHAERMALVDELRGHVLEAIHCPHANHVLRKVIATLPSQALTFILLELLSQGREGVVQTAKHRFGCRIIVDIIHHFARDHVAMLVECFLGAAASLCTHRYGNYVVQCLLEEPGLGYRCRLHQAMAENLAVIGTSFHGSIVVLKALVYGDNVEKQNLAHAIVGVQGLLATLARMSHGKEAVQIVLATLQGSARGAAQHQLTMSPLKISRSSRSPHDI